MEFSRIGYLAIYAVIVLAHNGHATPYSMFKAALSNTFHMTQIDRMKRETTNSSSNQTSNVAREADLCVVKCLRTTEQRLGALQEEGKGKNGQAALSPQAALNRDYDAKDFEKLCEAYRPGSQCLDKCQGSKLKRAAVRGMQLLHYMCVDKYDDFKASLPCMNNASSEAEEVCKPKCSEYESAVNRLEDLSSNRDLISSTNQQELKNTLAGSCLYVDCLSRCGEPITEKQCGKKVAELDEELVKQVFNSLRHTVTALGAADHLPNECLKLSG